MTNSRTRTGRPKKPRTKPLSEKQLKQYERKYGGEITAERLDELKAEYARKGWTEVQGLITLGFISHCGEFFNCFCKKTGHFYSFGTTEALKAKLAAQMAVKDEN